MNKACAAIKSTIVAVTVWGCWLGMSSTAFADSGEYAGQSPITWHVSGGYSAPGGQIADYLQGGFVLSGGFTYAPNAGPLGLRGDVSLSAHEATNQFLNYGTAVTGVQVDSGTGQFFSFALGPSYTVPFVGRSRAYGFAQLGIYHESLQLTQTALFQGDFCDPYFGYCDFGVFVGDNLVYEDNRTRAGWDAGVGIEFPAYFRAAYFVEVGYHRLLGSQPIEYVPVEFGIRF